MSFFRFFLVIGLLSFNSCQAPRRSPDGEVKKISEIPKEEFYKDYYSSPDLG